MTKSHKDIVVGKNWFAAACETAGRWIDKGYFEFGLAAAHIAAGAMTGNRFYFAMAALWGAIGLGWNLTYDLRRSDKFKEWSHAAASTVKRTVRHISRSGVPEILTGAVMGGAAYVTHDWRIGAYSVLPLGRGGLRALETYQALQRLKGMHGHHL